MQTPNELFNMPFLVWDQLSPPSLSGQGQLKIMTAAKMLLEWVIPWLTLFLGPAAVSTGRFSQWHTKRPACILPHCVFWTIQMETVCVIDNVFYFSHGSDGCQNASN